SQDLVEGTAYTLADLCSSGSVLHGLLYRAFVLVMAPPPPIARLRVVGAGGEQPLPLPTSRVVGGAAFQRPRKLHPSGPRDLVVLEKLTAFPEVDHERSTKPSGQRRDPVFAALSPADGHLQSFEVDD